MQTLEKIPYANEREKLFQRFSPILTTDPVLSRQIVSFQANKKNSFYRWFKYKEGFSSNLVQYYINKFDLVGKDVLDPFAGAGTTLFAAAELGCNATGIELLPVGVFAIETRQAVQNVSYADLKQATAALWQEIENSAPERQIHHIPITDGAFPPETEAMLNAYLAHCNKLGGDIGKILKFAAFAILEEISYTRKDGQYLRWDYRSNRRQGSKPFDKGRIIPFREAVENKLSDILEDLSPIQQTSLIDHHSHQGKITIYEDSCLTRLSALKDESFDLVVTSPPYCNRYDYTRTYALELVFLGNGNEDVKRLRQEMLSCTVENKSKIEQLREFYRKQHKSSEFESIIAAYDRSKAMKEIMEFMEHFKETHALNNNGVVRMIGNYFLEMCFTIYELARVLRKGGRIIMVNDNVRYAGEEIPVDLILSEFAETFGLKARNIFVLQQQKGNSSQQMGNHGRSPLRKCVYLWEKQ